MEVIELKQQAAEYAAQFIEPGMVVGLGAGSTAILAVRHIGHLLKTGALRDIVGIPCSTVTEAEARAVNIPLSTLEDHPVIDLTIDGADEVDPQLELIKGGGGALTREKIVAQATRREIIIVDETKLVPALGTTWAVPVEVVPFGYRSQWVFLEMLGAQVKLRQGAPGQPYLTDQGNYILDCNFGRIANPTQLAEQLKQRTGIVEHGLFIGLAMDVIVASDNGIRHLTRST
ncbi:MAG TPA: ribose-5-phosphate isomerase RpiA [Phototrophicaceae bacterium]|nr:ribose-5-phosphate isomerase RpiA [Phototrophicaceae bacterium]